MPTFKYTAVGADGVTIKATGEAPSQLSMENELLRRGLTATKIRERKGFSQIEITKERVPKTDIMHFSRQLAAFVRSGIPISEALRVVAEGAACARLSFERGEPVETDTAETMADGLAVRVPVAEALAIYRRGADRVVAVSDAEIAAAMRIFFSDTHQVAEGAGAAALAALLREREAMRGRDVAVVLSGGNVDTPVYRRVLAG